MGGKCFATPVKIDFGITATIQQLINDNSIVKELVKTACLFQVAEGFSWHIRTRNYDLHTDFTTIQNFVVSCN